MVNTIHVFEEEEDIEEGIIEEVDKLFIEGSGTD